jgi:diguanylate cyclase (GGDEF)-like protein
VINKNNWPIAKCTFAALLCLQVVTLVVMLLIAHFGGEDAYLTHAKRLMKAVATESLQNVDSLLSPAEDLVVVAASLIEDGAITLAPDKTMEQYFFHNIRVNTNFSGMYFGWNNGDFLYVTRNNPKDALSPFLTKVITKNSEGVRETQLINRNRLFEETERKTLVDEYDPRTRPWFKALEKGSIMWTQPYIYHTSRLPGVTVSIPVVNSQGEALGVLGLDIEVSNLSNYLSKNELSSNSIALIATDDDRMVAHTDLDLILVPNPNDDDKQQLATLKQMGDECIDAALVALTAQGLSFVSDEIRSVDFQHEGQRHHAVFNSYNKLGVNWTVVVISPESDFLSTIRNAQFWQIVCAVIGSLLLTILAFVVALRVLKPVKELQERVLRNPLTGLYNRRALDQIGVGLLKDSHQKGQPVSVAIIDIDLFKAINDTFGHSVGDEVLVSVSERMKQVLKKTDLLVRYGGEEFVVLLFGADLATANTICERLQLVVKHSKILTQSGTIPVTVSVGVSEIKPEDDSYRAALDLADQALYVAKRNGRDQVCTSDKIDCCEPVVSP